MEISALREQPRRGRCCGRRGGEGEWTRIRERATDISVPRERPQGCVTADDRRERERERRPIAADAPRSTATGECRTQREGEQRSVAAEISAPRKRLRGDVAAEATTIVAPLGRPRGYFAASKRREGEVDEAAGEPRKLASRADGRANVSPWMTVGEGRGSGGPPLRTRPARRPRGDVARGGEGGGPPLRRSAPRAIGCGGTLLRRPQNGRGNRRSARTAARTCCREKATETESGRGGRTVTDIRVRRGRPRGCVAADERQGGERERRPAASDELRDGRGGGCCARRGGGRPAATEISALRKQPRGDDAAEAAKRPRGSAPRADGRRGMSPRMSGAEVRGSGDLLPPTRPRPARGTVAGDVAPRDSRGNQRPAQMAAGLICHGQVARRGGGVEAHRPNTADPDHFVFSANEN